MEIRKWNPVWFGEPQARKPLQVVAVMSRTSGKWLPEDKRLAGSKHNRKLRHETGLSGRQWRKYRQFLKRGRWPMRRRDRA